MTQIIYDGRYLLADRKCTRGSTALESVKLRHHEKEGIKRYWAFSGSYLECSLGDEVIESGFDKRVIERVQSVIPADNLHNYYGLMVEVTSEGRKVYIINYTGDRCEVPSNQFVAVGAMYEEITFAYNTWKHCAEMEATDGNAWFCREPVKAVEFFQLAALANFLRFVLKGTYFDQQDLKFDSYDFEKGGKYQCV